MSFEWNSDILKKEEILVPDFTLPLCKMCCHYKPKMVCDWAFKYSKKNENDLDFGCFCSKDIVHVVDEKPV
jgi:hypothetical protein